MSATDGKEGKCRYCGSHHEGACPRVKAVEYYRDGSVKRVEFHDPKPVIVSRRPETNVTWWWWEGASG